MPARWDTVNASAGAMRCYVAPPAAPGRCPVVIVIQHAGGVDGFIRSMCDRLAEAGYVAVAPDLYHREDPNNSDDPLTRMGRLRDDAIAVDVNAAIEHAAALPECEPDRIGITGFCMGGRVAYMMCALNERLKAAVIFYGGNIMVAWGEGAAPFDLTARINCPVLGLFGADDPNPNPADVARIDAEMTKLGKQHEFHNYPGAGHAFMNEDRPSYREEAAKDAWSRCIAWFDRHLKG